MPSKEEIIKALETLKTVCDTAETCDKCPLYDGCGDCGITSLEPGNWAINKPGEVWRALL